MRISTGKLGKVAACLVLFSTALILPFGVESNVTNVSATSFGVGEDWYSVYYDDDGIGYHLQDGTNSYTVVDYKGTKSNLVIPGSVNGHDVTGIANFAFKDSPGEKLTSVALPNTFRTLWNSHGWYQQIFGGGSFAGNKISKITIYKADPILILHNNLPKDSGLQDDFSNNCLTSYEWLDINGDLTNVRITNQTAEKKVTTRSIPLNDLLGVQENASLEPVEITNLSNGVTYSPETKTFTVPNSLPGNQFTFHWLQNYKDSTSGNVSPFFSGDYTVDVDATSDNGAANSSMASSDSSSSSSNGTSSSDVSSSSTASSADSSSASSNDTSPSDVSSSSATSSDSSSSSSNDTSPSDVSSSSATSSDSSSASSNDTSSSDVSSSSATSSDSSSASSNDTSSSDVSSSSTASSADSSSASSNDTSSSDVSSSSATSSDSSSASSNDTSSSDVSSSSTASSADSSSASSNDTSSSDVSSSSATSSDSSSASSNDTSSSDVSSSSTASSADSSSSSSSDTLSSNSTNVSKPNNGSGNTAPLGNSTMIMSNANQPTVSEKQVSLTKSDNSIDLPKTAAKIVHNINEHRVIYSLLVAVVVLFTGGLVLIKSKRKN